MRVEWEWESLEAPSVIPWTCIPSMSGLSAFFWNRTGVFEREANADARNMPLRKDERICDDDGH